MAVQGSFHSAIKTRDNAASQSFVLFASKLLIYIKIGLFICSILQRRASMSQIVKRCFLVAAAFIGDILLMQTTNGNRSNPIWEFLQSNLMLNLT